MLYNNVRSVLQDVFMVGQIDLCKFTFPATGALSSPPPTQVCKLCIGVTVVQVGLSVMYYRELQ